MKKWKGLKKQEHSVKCPRKGLLYI